MTNSPSDSVRSLESIANYSPEILPDWVRSTARNAADEIERLTAALAAERARAEEAEKEALAKGEALNAMQRRLDAMDRQRLTALENVEVQQRNTLAFREDWLAEKARATAAESERDALREALEKEREECAKVADAEARKSRESEARPSSLTTPYQGTIADVHGCEALTAEDIAAAIRARTTRTEGGVNGR